MFDRPGDGIGVDDLAWIYRDEYVYYVELAHALGDPGDWPRFQQDLLRALTAAFGHDAHPVNGEGLTARQRRTLQLLDEICRRYDPATDWPAFFDTLWSRRHAIRPDLP